MSQLQYELSQLLEKYGVRGLADQLATVLRQRAREGKSFPYDPVNFKDNDPVGPGDLQVAASNFEADLF